MLLKLKKLPMTVGGGRDTDLRMISRKHCELDGAENTLCIRDLAH